MHLANDNQNQLVSPLNRCIENVSGIMEKCGWKYEGGIIDIGNETIVLDSDYNQIPLQEAINAVYPSIKIVIQERLKCHALQDFLALDLKPRENIITPWLPTQGLVMVYASRGVGKTYFALTIALAVASGSMCFKWQVTKPCGVLYLDGEMPAATMQERLKRLIGVNPTELPLKLITRDLNACKHFSLCTPAGQQEIEKHIEGVGLIIVDNISTLCPGKENDAESWAPAQDWSLRMRARGISVLFIHHAGKGGSQRGTSKREDILDTIIALRRPVGYSATEGAVFELHFEKSRGFVGEEAESIQLSLTEGDDKLDWQTQTVEYTTYQKVIDLANDGVNQTEIAKELDKNKSTVSRYIKQANQEGKLLKLNQ